MPPEKTRITLYLDPDIKTDLESVAKFNDRSMNMFITILIKRAIAEAKKNGDVWSLTDPDADVFVTKLRS